MCIVPPKMYSLACTLRLFCRPLSLKPVSPDLRGRLLRTVTAYNVRALSTMRVDLPLMLEISYSTKLHDMRAGAATVSHTRCCGGFFYCSRRILALHLLPPHRHTVWHWWPAAILQATRMSARKQRRRLTVRLTVRGTFDDATHLVASIRHKRVRGTVEVQDCAMASRLDRTQYRGTLRCSGR